MITPASREQAENFIIEERNHERKVGADESSGSGRRGRRVRDRRVAAGQEDSVLDVRRRPVVELCHHLRGGHDDPHLLRAMPESRVCEYGDGEIMD